MPPWAYHSSVFEVTKDWQTFEINFSDFEKKSGMSPKPRFQVVSETSVLLGYGRNFDVRSNDYRVSVFFNQKITHSPKDQNFFNIEITLSSSGLLIPSAHNTFLQNSRIFNCNS